ncbi:hypothetical protein [Cucumibacter marinus]|uniref:hypothetical protein n=1 Tax=Cucumibacter marinus TaxID=1121252 RepID=UPI00041FFAB6|nr:hypothetical protein [Cucumibacter marinus]
MKPIARAALTAILFALALAASAGTASAQNQFFKKPVTEERFDFLFMSVSSQKQFMRGITIMYYDRGHGTQIEYVDGRGHTWLWYPGNPVVLPGDYKVLPSGLRYEQKVKAGSQTTVKQGVTTHICYRYGSNTFNPVTITRGGDFDCAPAPLLMADVIETAKGDIFGLAGRKAVPFKLSRRKSSFERLLQKCDDCR